MSAVPTPARVMPVRGSELEIGNIVWAHDDGDWLKIDHLREADGDMVVYRADGSEATFGLGKFVLVRAER